MADLGLLLPELVSLDLLYQSLSAGVDDAVCPRSPVEDGQVAVLPLTPTLEDARVVHLDVV